MNKILIDTMQIYDLLTEEAEEGPYYKFAEEIKNQKIGAVISVVTLTELTIHLGRDIYKEKLNELLSTNLEIIDVDRTIALRAGELHMLYKVPLGDSLIAATGIIEGIKHVFTEDEHFDSIVNLIKPINLKAVLKMAR